MRICIFARTMHRHRSYYSPPPVLLARVFAKLGHDVIALTTELPDGSSGIFAEDSAEVHYLPSTPSGKVSKKFWAASAARFDQLHSDRPFDLILGRGKATWGYFRNSCFSGQVPVISHEGTYPKWLHILEKRARPLVPLLAGPLSVLLAFRNWEYRTCMQRSDRVICNSPALAGALNRIYWWRRPKTGFIPYGFDVSAYVAADPLTSSERAPRLVSVGRLTWDKGAIAMIDILAKVQRRDVILEAIGPVNSKVRAAMVKRAKLHGVAERIIIAGPEHNSKLPERLAGAVAFLFPSTHAEGFPKVVMEGMAAALPLISYRLPGIETLIEDGVTGWLVPSRDTDRAAVKIDELLGDPAAATAMGAAGRRRIEKVFPPERIAQSWETLIQTAVSEHKQGF